jgi:cytochrome b involved in lipid metabolism
VKKFVFSVFVAFWASIGTIVVMELLRPQSSLSEHTNFEKEFSASEVAEHSTPADCWMIIEGDVFDFTDYLDLHPAPPEAMETWCGMNATEGMRTKGKGRDHSPAAWAMMNKYRIGRLKPDR